LKTIEGILEESSRKKSTKKLRLREEGQMVEKRVHEARKKSDDPVRCGKEDSQPRAK